MSKSGKNPRFAALVVGFLVAAGPALAQDKPADAILKELDAVKLPQFDGTKRGDQAFIREYIANRQKAMEKRGEIILKLYKAAPDHPKIAKLMPERWQGMNPMGPKGDELLKEVTEVFEKTANKELKLEAAFAKAQIQLLTSRSHAAPDLSGVDEFIKLAPKDARAAQLLYSATFSIRDTAAKAAIEERILKEFPDSHFGAMIKASKRQREAVGKPFDLEFADAITGSTVSMKNLKGKVVVVDFWATWCGPCVVEMPHMKELYAKFKDQGVEFIGVSLDHSKEAGGLAALKKFVKEKEITWPQYYQGNYWNSDFSKSWGINSIPCVFVVDTEGKLYSVEGRGKLEQMIPELLKKKATPAGAGAGAGGQ